MVCWYGGCAKKDWDHQNRCRPQATECEVHPLPAVDDTLARLASAKF